MVKKKKILCAADEIFRMVTDRYTDNRTENGIRLYSCLVHVMSKPPQ